MHALPRFMLWPLFWSSAAGAQTITKAGVESSSSYFGGAWIGLVTLALLVGLAALLLWFSRTYTGKSSTGPVQVLATQSLGPRDRILIVRIEDRILAIGQTPTQITLLTELESFDDSTGPVTAGMPAFAGVLDKVLKRVQS